jgi:hypothetical protein
MTMAARNAIKFLAAQAKISELDAYALCSIAVSFRVTQVVDIVRGAQRPHPEGDLRARTQTRDNDGVSTRLRAKLSIQNLILLSGPKIVLQ